MRDFLSSIGSNVIASDKADGRSRADDLMRTLEACADIFKPAECTNYFVACGYDTT